MVADSGVKGVGKGEGAASGLCWGKQDRGREGRDFRKLLQSTVHGFRAVRFTGSYHYLGEDPLSSREAEPRCLRELSRHAGRKSGTFERKHGIQEAGIKEFPMSINTIRAVSDMSAAEQQLALTICRASPNTNWKHGCLFFLISRKLFAPPSAKCNRKEFWT